MSGAAAEREAYSSAASDKAARAKRLYPVVVLGLVVLLSTGCLLTAFWIDAKAVVAQVLLDRAWSDTLAAKASGQGVDSQLRPWPWADIHPVGRLLTPDGDALIVLDGTSGEALAFGPGRLSQSAPAGDSGGQIVLAGHRDTHFAFLQHIRLKQMMTLEDASGGRTAYEVSSIRVVDSSSESLRIDSSRAELQLISCYPFDQLAAGGPLRYVVTAVPVKDV